MPVENAPSPLLRRTSVPGGCPTEMASTMIARRAPARQGSSKSPAVPPSISSTSWASGWRSRRRRTAWTPRPSSERMMLPMPMITVPSRTEVMAGGAPRRLAFEHVGLVAGDDARELTVALVDVDQDRAVDVERGEGAEDEHQQEVQQS